MRGQVWAPDIASVLAGGEGSRSPVGPAAAQGARHESRDGPDGRGPERLRVESLRTWVKQTDVDEGVEPGVTTVEAKRIRELDQENREPRRASDLLRRAAVLSAAELDRPSIYSLRSSTTTATSSQSSLFASTCRWLRGPTQLRRSGGAGRPRDGSRHLRRLLGSSQSGV